MITHQSRSRDASTLTSSSLWLLLCRALPHHARTLARREHKLTFKLSSVDHEKLVSSPCFRPTEGDRPFVPPLATIQLRLRAS